MPRRFFRKFAVKRHHLTEQWWLAPFAHLLHDPRLWAVSRRNVVPAFALGLFVAYMPFPGHMLIAGLSALLLRVNIPVAVASVWASNPVTMYPMFYVAFETGRLLLRLPPAPFQFEMSVEWLLNGFIYVWQPLLLGSVLLGSILALVGFISLDLLWRASITDYLARRRKRRRG